MGHRFDGDQRLINVHQKFGAPPQKDPRMISGNFEYRWNASESGAANCDHSCTSKVNLVNFSPEMAKIEPEIRPNKNHIIHILVLRGDVSVLENYEVLLNA